MRTDPKRFLFRMMLFLMVVSAICAALFGPLKTAFLGNPALNSVILATLGLGILYVIRQTLRLTPERKWLLLVQKTGSLDTPEKRPVLLATVYACWLIPDMMRNYPHCHCARCLMALLGGLMRSVKFHAI